MDGTFVMVKWVQVIEASELARWDELLLSAEDYSIFQSLSWGEYKRNNNQYPLRYWAVDNNSNIVCMVQFIVKSYPAEFSTLWSVGGPVFIFNDKYEKKLSIYLESLIITIKNKFKRYVVRFNSLIPNGHVISYEINKVCVRPLYQLSSGYSVLMSIDNSIGQMRSNMTTKHRYYSKKAANASLSWVAGNETCHLNDFIKVYEIMVKDKMVNAIVDKPEIIIELYNRLRNNILIVTGKINGIPITSCLVLIMGTKSYYLYAATNREGREVSASYAMFERLALELKERNATNFDFGCIDPMSFSAKGVDHFKKGFGGQIVKYFGEWEFASSTLLLTIFNLCIKLLK
jgi:lipid II:glycine glycyltransferase (peptidoglycan interpeptide bridge formation enzyme)